MLFPKKRLEGFVYAKERKREKLINVLFICINSIFVVWLYGKESNAASSGPKDIKNIKVGVSVGHTQEERWQREIDMFRAYAKEHGFELLVQSAENNAQNKFPNAKIL